LLKPMPLLLNPKSLLLLSLSALLLFSNLFNDLSVVHSWRNSVFLTLAKLAFIVRRIVVM
jgi:hypothetical protein